MAEQTITLTATGAAYVDSKNPDTNYSSPGIVSYENLYVEDVFVKLPPLPDSLQFNKLYRASVNAFFRASRGSSTDTPYARAYTINDSFELSTVTYRNAPKNGLSFTTASYINSPNSFEEFSLSPSGSVLDDGSNVRNLLLKNGFSIYGHLPSTWPVDSYLEIDTSKGITLSIVYDPDNKLTPSKLNASASGDPSYKNPKTEIVFNCSPYYSTTPASFHCQADRYPYRTKTALYWKLQGTENYQVIETVDEDGVIAVPPNTFPAGQISYYMGLTLETGDTVYSNVASFSTVAPLRSARPFSPNNAIIAATEVNMFRWFVPAGIITSAELQYSQDQTTWSSFLTIQGNVCQAEVPANTFSGGTYYWRLRVYNEDGAAGPWSSSVPFVAFGAPPQPIVETDAAPFTTISWSSTNQVAYELVVDTKRYGPNFGYNKNFTLPFRLLPGSHRAQVRVQNSFGLWSPYGESTFTVLHQSSGIVSLSVVYGETARLSFSDSYAETENFYIVRNGELVAVTSDTEWEDLTAAGNVWYQVYNRLPSNDFHVSFANYGTISVERLIIASMEESPAQLLPLRLTDKSEREFAFALGQAVSFRHVKGADYPVAERSRYKTASGSFDVAYPYTKLDEAAAFEALLGKTVVIKTPGGSSTVGVISSMTKTEKHFFVVYTFTLTRTHWEGLP